LTEIAFSEFKLSMKCVKEERSAHISFKLEELCLAIREICGTVADISLLCRIQSEKMNSIIERAYQTFSKYNIKSQLDVCTHCCVSTEEVRNLTNTPLNKLSLELIYRYNTAATSDKPTIEEFKYFLPRYLELRVPFAFT